MTENKVHSVIELKIKREIVEDDRQIVGEIDVQRFHENSCPICQKSLPTVENVEILDTWQEKLLILLIFLRENWLKPEETARIYQFPIIRICQNHVKDAGRRLERILQDGKDLTQELKEIQGDEVINNEDFRQIAQDFVKSRKIPEIVVKIKKNPLKCRKVREFRQRSCVLCGRTSRIENSKFKVLEIHSAGRAKPRLPQNDVIWLTAVSRGFLTHDDVFEVLQMAQCLICPEHLTETCDALFEILQIQNPDEMQKASMKAVDESVQKLNSWRGADFYNDSTFLMIATLFTKRYWSGRVNFLAQIREKTANRTLAKVTAEFPKKRAAQRKQDADSSQEIDNETLIKICKTQFPKLINYKGPVECPEAPTPSKSQNPSNCLLCVCDTDSQNEFNQFHMEKVFSLLVPVLEGTLTVLEAREKLSSKQWTEICPEHLSTSSKSILKFLGVAESSEIPTATDSSLRRLYEKAREIQVNMTFDFFLNKLEKFVQFYVH